MNGISRLLLVISAFLLSQAATAATKPLLVLVPGFFNIPGMIPGAIPVEYNYFSEAARSSLREEGFEVVVIKNLDPLGSMENNGRTRRCLFARWSPFQLLMAERSLPTSSNRCLAMKRSRAS